MNALKLRHFQRALTLCRQWLREEVLFFVLAEPSTPSHQVRVLTEQEASLYDLPYDTSTVCDYRAAGWELYTWFENDVPVSFAWARVAREHYISEVDVTVRAAEPVGWIIHCVTNEAYRGRGFYPLLIAAVAGLLRAPRSHIYCLRANSASRRGITKAGFSAIGSLVRILGRITRKVPDLPISE